MLHCNLKMLDKLEVLEEKEKRKWEEAEKAVQLAMQVATTANSFMLFIKEELRSISMSLS